MCVLHRIYHQKWKQPTGTRCPLARVFDVYFSRGVDEAQELTRANRDGVLFVVDVSQVQVGVHVVGECLVSDTRETISDGQE